jgi:hypothetical protein
MPTAKEYFEMTDREIAELVVAQVTNSRDYDKLAGIFSMKVALKNQETTELMGIRTKELVGATKNLVYATWGLVVVTFILIAINVRHG